MKCEERDLTNTAQNRIGQWLTLMKTAPTLHHLPVTLRAQGQTGGGK